MAAFKYRAFVSYSHRDAAWAAWLHRALETYRIDKDLIGRETAQGPVPKTLRPIFRDREDFAAGHSLNEQTLVALEASQFLVVICSPNAAQSPYVNEEVHSFKAMGRNAQILPVIVDGEPGDPQRECFPPALRVKLGPDGGPTVEREEPIAADARSGSDGRETAKLKIVAGLLGLGLDEIRRRAERARRRQIRLRIGVASIAAGVIAIALLGWTWEMSYGSRLDAAQMLNIETDAAAVCLRASTQAATGNVPEPRRIAFAVKCVRVLSNDADELSRETRVSVTFISSLQGNVDILQRFADAGKLTAEQSDLLKKATTLVGLLRQRCRAAQSDGVGRDRLGFAC
jgi:hypothetical protein